MIVLATLTGWPLAAVTLGVGSVIGLILGAIASSSPVNDLELRVRMLRRELGQIARDPAEAESYALAALARDDVLRARRDEIPDEELPRAMD